MTTKKLDSASAPNIDYVHLQAMRLVKNGADIYMRSLAETLREVEKLHPEYIDICEPKTWSGRPQDRKPYFGAILTKAGRVAISKNFKGGAA